ncbi:DUF2341 domain-containing protein [Candidatus Woesearchaeota archaeon]|nr:DUF2341 domain-containing protein [Candidatus Woesearchaeota archaeon]
MRPTRTLIYICALLILIIFTQSAQHIGHSDSFEAKITQGEAKINKPVKWTLESVQGYPLEVPKDATNVEMFVDGVKTVYQTSTIQTIDTHNQKTLVQTEVQDEPSTGQLSGQVIITYETPAPVFKEKKEKNPNTFKTISVLSDHHYENVSASTDIDETDIKAHLFHVIDGIRVDVTYDHSYNVTYIDSDGNGIFDRIDWTIPHMSDQYFEVGIATVNTNKSTYLAGEQALIMMAVLDNEGYMVPDADVKLTILKPDGTDDEFYTDRGTIVEKEKGIYHAVYDKLDLEGEYLLNVEAVGEGVDNVMASQFMVRSDNEFDIIRTAPMSVDPWTGMFESKIKVVIINSTGPSGEAPPITAFDLYEKVPGEISVSNFGDAELTSVNGSWILKWTGLENNSEVSYFAQPPLRSPDLFELGPSTIMYGGDTYGDGTYEESRTWYLAIDPKEEETKTCAAIVTSGYASGDDTGTCSQVDSPDGTRPAGGDNALSTYTQNSGLSTPVSADITFDTNTESGKNIEDAILYIQWYVDDSAGTSCNLEVDNGTGWSSISTTCYTTDATRSYDVSNYVKDSGAANGFKFRLTYNGDKDGSDKTDLLRIDHVYMTINISEEPTYDIWGINVTNGAQLTRGEHVLAYTHWNYTSGITNAFLMHNGNGTDINYTIPSPFDGDWTNYTLDTSNVTEFAFAGRVDVESMYANDIGPYSMTSPIKWFFVHDNAIVSSSTTNPGTVNQSQDAKVLCQILDDNLGVAIDDYNVYYYQNGSYLGSNKTNESGWAEYVLTYNNPGIYNISCKISDSGYYYAMDGENESDEVVLVYDNVPPTVTLVSPETDQQDLDGAVTLFFNVTDVGSSIYNCTVVINNTLNKSKFTISETSTNNITTSLSIGPWEWGVNCSDSSENKNIGASDTRIINIAPDDQPPIIYHMQPPPGADTEENVTIWYNASDTLSDISECTLIFDGTSNQTNLSMINDDLIYIDLYNLIGGDHSWRVNCTDDSPLQNNILSSTWIFTVGSDETPPDIILIEPDNETTDTDGDITIIFTVDDYLSGVEQCSLYLNGSFNQSNMSIDEAVTQYFYFDNMQEGQYRYYINCSDDSGNDNTKISEEKFFDVNYDFDAPVISLVTPLEDYHSLVGSLDLVYNVTDENEITNCSLYINGTWNDSSTSITKDSNQTFSLVNLDNAYYGWNIVCYDVSDNKNNNNSETRNFSVGPDLLAPQITLFAPSNESHDTDGEVVFTYQVYDESSGIESCTVYVEGTPADTDSDVVENSTEGLIASLSDGSYSWFINCTDDSPQQNTVQSETRQVNVTIMFETNFTIAMDDHSVATGEILEAVASFKDTYHNGIAGADVYGYIIHNLGADNQTLPWLNSAFPRRTEIAVFNSGDSISGSPIDLTLDTASLISNGFLNSDCSDLRFGDQGNNNLDYYLYDLDAPCDNAATKVLVIIENLWADTTHSIGVYYDNTGASDAQNRIPFPVVDNFDDGDTFSSGYWTTNYLDAGDEWGTTTGDQTDGTTSASSNINCDRTCQREGGRASSFETNVDVTSNSTVYWNWRVTSGTLRFKLDGVETDSTTSGTWSTASELVEPGTHTIEFEFENTAQASYFAYVDQVYLISNNVAQGSTSSESEYIATLTPQTTDAEGNAILTWDTSGQSATNYSITGYANKGSYWEDNGYFDFGLGADYDAPWYTVWGINNSEESVVRGEHVLAYSTWYDNVGLSSAFLEHNGESANTNYTANIETGKNSSVNYTMDTSDGVEFNHIGIINITSMYVNDSSDIWNNSQPGLFFLLHSTAEIDTGTLSSSSVPLNEEFNVSCHVRDEFDNAAIQNYPVNFHLNGTYKGQSTTDNLGWANFTIEPAISGDDIVVKCNITNKSSLFYNLGSQNYFEQTINVTYSSAPVVTTYRPENYSIKTNPYITMGFYVNDSGSLDVCELYGNWTGWHLNQTKENPENGGYPNINYFDTVRLTHGSYAWYVTCNNTQGNATNSSTSYFNLSLLEPQVTLVFPEETLYEPGSFIFNYTVDQPESGVSIDNCTLLIDSVPNQTSYSPIAKGVNQNFTVDYLGYGQHRWDVLCYGNNTLGGSAYREIYVFELSLTGPANGTDVDRDAVWAYSDIITLEATETGGTSGILVEFLANLTDPDLPENKNIFLGSNTTDGSGVARVTIDPEFSHRAGSYVWWARFSTWKTNVSINEREFDNYGGISVEFKSPTVNPDEKYMYFKNVTVEATAQSYGNESTNLLVNSYSLELVTNLSSVDSAKEYNKTMEYSGADWSTEINTTLLAFHGDWNATFKGQISQYLKLDSVEDRTFFLNMSGYTTPTIILDAPTNGDTLSTSFVNFRWKVLSDYFSLLYCNVTVNGTLNITNEPVVEDTWHTALSDNFTNGFYSYNITCRDEAESMNYSSTYIFEIDQGSLADLAAVNITFSDYHPIEETQLGIRVNVSNYGSLANNVSVRLNITEWNGSTWSLIYSNETNLSLVSSSSSVIAEFNWTASSGSYNFSAMVDGDDQIVEGDENNNFNYTALDIEAWSYIYGVIEAGLALKTIEEDNFIYWTVVQPTGNVYFSDTDSSFGYTDLKGFDGTNDFIEADTVLGITGHNDSIENMYDSNGDDSADQTRTFTIAGSPVNGVAVRNTTNSTTFVTGILYDSGAPGAEYDGSQDLVFITQINYSAVGKYGIYDFECRVPASLEKLKGISDILSVTVEIS